MIQCDENFWGVKLLISGNCHEPPIRERESNGYLEGHWCSGTRESSEGLAGSLHSCECSYGDGAPRRERAEMLAAVQGPPAHLLSSISWIRPLDQQFSASELLISRNLDEPENYVARALLPASFLGSLGGQECPPHKSPHK